MKKVLLILASLALLVGVVAQAGASNAPASKAPASKTTAQTSKAPPVLSAATRAADLAKFGNKRITPKQLKALGAKKASRQQVARLKLLKKSSKARTSIVGSYYWFTGRYYGNSWYDAYYSGPYYSYPWWPYYVIYDNFKTCTNSGTGCFDAHAYTYQYYLYYYGVGWYYWTGHNGYTTGHQSIGYGPYGS